MTVKPAKQAKQAPLAKGSDQFRRFVETARQLGADEDAERFEEKLRRIASVKPKPKPQKGKAGK
jgi:hypothetical protein